jgi:hypothetical protein
MKKPAKKRKGDSIQVAYSVMQDVIAISERPVKQVKRKGTKAKK